MHFIVVLSKACESATPSMRQICQIEIKISSLFSTASHQGEDSNEKMDSLES